jgi:hypothetical protein
MIVYQQVTPNAQRLDKEQVKDDYPALTPRQTAEWRGYGDQTYEDRRGGPGLRL